MNENKLQWGHYKLILLIISGLNKTIYSTPSAFTLSELTQESKKRDMSTYSYLKINDRLEKFKVYTWKFSYKSPS